MVLVASCSIRGKLPIMRHKLINSMEMRNGSIMRRDRLFTCLFDATVAFVRYTATLVFRTPMFSFSTSDDAHISIFKSGRELPGHLIGLCMLFVLGGICSAGMAHAQSTSGSWCTIVAAGKSDCGFGSPDAACGRQHEVYNKDASFYGSVPTDHWFDAVCSWCNPIEGTDRCSGVAPATVTFYCPDGYDRVPPGNCVKSGEPNREPPKLCNLTGGQSSPGTGNPIVLITGSKKFERVDFQSPTGSIDLRRKYSNQKSTGYSEIVPLEIASGWAYDFQSEIELYRFFGASSTVSLRMPNGSTIDFDRQSDGTMAPRFTSFYDEVRYSDYSLTFLDAWPSNLDNVRKIKHHWQLRDADGNSWIFEGVNSNYSNGDPDYLAARPTSLVRSGGIRSYFTYGSVGELLTMSDDFGHSTTFNWTYIDNGRVGQSGYIRRPVSVSSVMLYDGSRIVYSYNPIAAQVGSVSFPDRLSKFERFDSANTLIDKQEYLYEDSRYPYFITGIIDLRGVRTNSVVYDANGHVESSALAGGQDKSTVSYAYDTSSGVVARRTVTNALGKQAVYEFRGSGHGAWRFYGVTGVASTSCPSSTTAVTYDGNFYVTSETDEEGRKTTYSRDSQGHPTVITRGAP